MIFILILAIFRLTSSAVLLLRFSSKITPPFQKFCLGLLPDSSAEKASLASLLCGIKVTDPGFENLLRRSSLLHLFVVSGTHLVLLAATLRVLRVPAPVQAALLSIYAFMSGFEPPVVRAGLGLLLEKIWQPRSPGLRGDQRVLLAGLASLALFPSWALSRSLPLSWVAALALSWPRPAGQNPGTAVSRAFAAAVRIWILMTPLLWGWGESHPLGILPNLFIAPLVSFLLVPLGVVACGLPMTAIFFDAAMGGFRWLLERISEIPLPENQVSPLEPLGVWLWIGGLHLFVHWKMLRQELR